METRPEGRVNSRKGAAPSVVEMASMETRPEGRVNSVACYSISHTRDSFNGDASRRTRECHADQQLDAVATPASMETRPEGRVNRARTWLDAGELAKLQWRRVPKDA